MNPALEIDKRPPLTIVTLLALSTGALKVKLFPVSEMLDPMVRGPEKIVVPVPANCVKEKAKRELDTVTLLAFGIEMAPSATLAPTAPVNVMLPVPGLRVRSCPSMTAPSNAPPNPMEPPKTLVLIVRRAELFDVVVVVPATLKEFAAMVVTVAPTKRDPVPAPIIRLPSRVEAPTFAERVTDPVPLESRVSA
jgi:hypothetical protein